MGRNKERFREDSTPKHLNSATGCPKGLACTCVKNVFYTREWCLTPAEVNVWHSYRDACSMDLLLSLLVLVLVVVVVVCVCLCVCVCRRGGIYPEVPHTNARRVRAWEKWGDRIQSRKWTQHHVTVKVCCSLIACCDFCCDQRHVGCPCVLTCTSTVGNLPENREHVHIP